MTLTRRHRTRRPMPCREGWRVVAQPAGQLATDLEWYVVRLRPRSERKARRTLREAGYSVWLPMLKERGRNRYGRERTRATAWLVGYAFVGVPPGRADFRAIEEADGVAGVLGSGGTPRQVPVKRIQELADALASATWNRADRERPKGAVVFALNDRVRIVDGPFASFMGRVAELLSGGRVKAEVEVFGRSSLVEVDADQLSAA